MIRCDVNNNQISGQVERVYTVPVDDPLANDINLVIHEKLNSAGRYQEADEIGKVPGRQPMGSAAQGTELPGDMEPQS